jgi:hypothetical protein
MPNEYDMVKLRKNLPEKNLLLGAVGAVLLVFNEPGLPRAYEVEFTNTKGEVLLITLFEEDIEKTEEI